MAVVLAKAGNAEVGHFGRNPPMGLGYFRPLTVLQLARVE